MTVRELRDALAECDQDADVVTYSQDDMEWYVVNKVQVLEDKRVTFE